MTALPIARPATIDRSLLALAGLAGLVALRWSVGGLDPVDRLTPGLVFGAGLLVLARATGWRYRRPTAFAVGVGVLGGAVLVALAVATAGGRHWVPAAAAVPWAVITILVASSEELLLRGVVFGDLSRRFGIGAAVLVTSVAFALLHVPFYGWRAAPLDLGVGVVLAGLRLAGGSVAAPALAHVLADLATWWV
jgi:membrane protease YdiL (CAAX protease family)